MGSETEPDLRPTAAQIEQAAANWRADTQHGRFNSYLIYFRANWRWFPDMRAYVAAVLAAPEGTP